MGVLALQSFSRDGQLLDLDLLLPLLIENDELLHLGELHAQPLLSLERGLQTVAERIELTLEALFRLPVRDDQVAQVEQLSLQWLLYIVVLYVVTIVDSMR